MQKNQLFSANWRGDIGTLCSDDSIIYLQILLKLDWIERFTIQTNFRRVYSLEHNNAYTSLPIYTKRLAFGRRTVFISVLSGYTNPIISQI